MCTSSSMPNITVQESSKRSQNSTKAGSLARYSNVPGADESSAHCGGGSQSDGCVTTCRCAGEREGKGWQGGGEIEVG